MLGTGNSFPAEDIILLVVLSLDFSFISEHLMSGCTLSLMTRLRASWLVGGVIGDVVGGGREGFGGERL